MIDSYLTLPQMKLFIGGGYEYEVIPDEYIYNETDNKYYQKLVAYGEPIETNATVDLNSEWVSDSEDSNYTYFKSDSNVGVGSSYSQCKVTWSNLTSVTFKYMSSSEIGFDYLCVGKLDGEKFTAQPSDGDDNVYLSTYEKESGIYYEFTIECDEGEHHIWFCYVKDGSDNQGKDRGFIGVSKYSSPIILDVKQGSELPTEYKYGGISAENNKTYDINFKNVTLPNDRIVTVYEDFQKVEKTINYEYVDLGLSVKWATCNIGASSETDYGVYFQWGETSGVSGSLLGKYSDENYSWGTYEHCNRSETTLRKYNTDSSYGAVDNKTTLESVDDAATQIMGGDWRMPTKAEFQELLDNTTKKWFSNYNGTGVNVIKITSNKDGYQNNSIFIPMAGICDNGSTSLVGAWGSIATSSLYTSKPNFAWNLECGSGNDYMRSNLSRYFGMSVRGVHA